MRQYDRGDGHKDPADDSMIRFIDLNDILLVRRNPDTKSVDGIKANGGATLADAE